MVELVIEQCSALVQVFINMGMEQMDMDLQNMFERIMLWQSFEWYVIVSQVREILMEQELEGLMDCDVINEEGLYLVEDLGMIFVDELDKICGLEEG